MTDSITVVSNHPSDQPKPKPEAASPAAPEKESAVAPEADAPEAEVSEEGESAEPAEAASEEEAESEEEEKPAEPKKNKGGWQRRIEQRDQQIAALQSRLEQLEARGAPKQEIEKAEAKLDAAVDASGEPDPDKFETHKDYVKALVRWDREQADKAASEKSERERVMNEQKKLVSDYQTKASEFSKAHEDYQEVLSSVDDITPSAAIRQAVLEHGPELAYALAQDRAEYERINKLPPISAARALGRMEASLASNNQEPSAPKAEPKKLTRAPKPLEPVGKNAAASVRKDPSEMTQSEYERWRTEQSKKR